MRNYLFCTIIVLILISCSSSNHDTHYDKFIAELERVTIEDRTRIEFDNSPVHKPLTLTANGSGQVIVVDASNWTLYLMDDQGNFIDSTGGSGRGPNEYSAINQLHMGSDNQLYVYDAKSNDLTTYSISNNEFQLKKEITLPAYDNALFLESLYKTASGYNGVFKRRTRPEDKENTFEVYSLGEDLQLQEHLFEMPGNETYVSQGIQHDNPIGFTTLWEMTDSQFLYTTSNDLSVTSVNIQNDSSKQYDLSEVPKPIMGDEEINAIEERLKPTIQANPEMKELINKGKYLPYFISFTLGQDHFYFTLFTPGRANGIILRINKITREMRKIIVPPVFIPYAEHGNTLFGIDHTTGGANEILFLKLGS